MRRFAVWFAAGLSWSATVRAAPPCNGPDVHSDSSLDGRWTDSVPRVRARLATSEQIDRCARVDLSVTEGACLVAVTLPDGRSTSRRVAQPADLASTIEALLVRSPDVALATPSASAESPVTPTPPSADAATTQLATRATSRVQPELGLALSPRVSSEYLSVGPSFFAQAEVDGWLVGASGRWHALDDPTGAAPAAFTMHTVAVGATVGRRLARGPVLIDLLAGPELVYEWQSMDVAGTSAIASTPAPGEEEPPRSGAPGTAAALASRVSADRVDFRLDATARVSFPAASRLRLWGGLDLDASPARILSPSLASSDVRVFPSWGLGAALGISWRAW